MAVDNVSRLASTLPASAAVTVPPDIAIVECDATSAGFTVTLYKINDGAWHELVVRIVDTDSSGNTVTITDGTFSTTLDAAGAAVTLVMDYSGNWVIAGQYPVTSSAAATSSATSAGLAASAATSAVASGSLNTSSVGSTATSQNSSQSLNVSSAQSGVTSESLNVSSVGSTATSQNASQSLVISLVSSVANSG